MNPPTPPPPPPPAATANELSGRPMKVGPPPPPPPPPGAPPKQFPGRPEKGGPAPPAPPPTEAAVAITATARWRGDPARARAALRSPVVTDDALDGGRYRRPSALTHRNAEHSSGL